MNDIVFSFDLLELLLYGFAESEAFLLLAHLVFNHLNVVDRALFLLLLRHAQDFGVPLPNVLHKCCSIANEEALDREDQRTGLRVKSVRSTHLAVT